MNYLKTISFVVLINLFATAYAGTSNPNPVNPLIPQIEQLLHDSNLVVEKDITASVKFYLDENSQIHVREVNSPDKIVSAFLLKRLQDQHLSARDYITDRTYELPVKIKAINN